MDILACQDFLFPWVLHAAVGICKQIVCFTNLAQREFVNVNGCHVATQEAALSTQFFDASDFDFFQAKWDSSQALHGSTALKPCSTPTGHGGAQLDGFFNSKQPGYRAPLSPPFLHAPVVPNPKVWLTWGSQVFGRERRRTCMILDEGEGGNCS